MFQQANIDTPTTAPCGCPCKCKKLAGWAKKNKIATTVVEEWQSEWNKDGETAIDIALRFWAYLDM